MQTAPMPIAMKLNSFAFFDESIAPWMSPAATLPFTWAAKMIATIANGQQQTREMMAGTK
jgi:hypothetical protein